MTNTPLLSLCFGQSAEELTKALSEFVEKHPALFVDIEASHGVRDQKLIFEGLVFDVHFTKLRKPPTATHTIFYSGSRERLATALSIEFASHLAGAIRVPALVKAYLQLSVMLLEALDAEAVRVGEADLICGAEYFTESVEGYLSNGPFPALALIGFEESANGTGFHTKGLSAYCGQELSFVATSLPPGEMMRRVVRLVHDMATGGPITVPETLPDLDPRFCIELTPDQEQGLVTAILRNGAE